MDRISEYIMTVLVFGTVSSICNSLSHKKMSKPVKVFIGLAVVLGLFSPFLNLINELGDDFFEEIPDYSSNSENIYAETVKEAFDKGVSLSIAKKWNIPQKSVSVLSFGFDFKKLRADRISVTIDSKYMQADYRSIKEYIKLNFCTDENSSVNVEYNFIKRR